MQPRVSDARLFRGVTPCMPLIQNWNSMLVGTYHTSVMHPLFAPFLGAHSLWMFCYYTPKKHTLRIVQQRILYRWHPLLCSPISHVYSKLHLLIMKVYLARGGWDSMWRFAVTFSIGAVLGVIFGFQFYHWDIANIYPPNVWGLGLLGGLASLLFALIWGAIANRHKDGWVHQNVPHTDKNNPPVLARTKENRSGVMQLDCTYIPIYYCLYTVGDRRIFRWVTTSIWPRP